MQSRRFFLGLTLGAAAVLAFSAGHGRVAFAASEDAARSFLTDLGNRAIAELADESVDDATRRERFRALLVQAVDFPLISQQVLGKYWRTADEAQRKEFTVVLREALIARFAPLFDSYNGQTFEVTGSRTSDRDPTLVAASTDVIAPNGNVAKVEWYMKETDGQLRIYDFAAEGIRLTTSLKDEYSSVLRRADGDLSVLIDSMKQKLPQTASLE